MLRFSVLRCLHVRACVYIDCESVRLRVCRCKGRYQNVYYTTHKTTKITSTDYIKQLQGNGRVLRYERAGIGVPCTSARAGGVQVHVPAAESGDSVVCTQLLLPMWERESLLCLPVCLPWCLPLGLPLLVLALAFTPLLALVLAFIPVLVAHFCDYLLYGVVGTQILLLMNFVRVCAKSNVYETPSMDENTHAEYCMNHGYLPYLRAHVEYLCVWCRQPHGCVGV